LEPIFETLPMLLLRRSKGAPLGTLLLQEKNEHVEYGSSMFRTLKGVTQRKLNRITKACQKKILFKHTVVNPLINSVGAVRYFNFSFFIFELIEV
jgi:hypothetical protein